MIKIINNDIDKNRAEDAFIMGIKIDELREFHKKFKERCN